MKRSDDSFRRVLRGKSIEELRDRIGRDWLGVCAYIQRARLNEGDAWIKTISIRNDDDGCFIVIRARVGASDVVMMRQAGRMEYAVSFISYMIHKGSWKADRYGVQSSVEEINDSYKM